MSTEPFSTDPSPEYQQAKAKVDALSTELERSRDPLEYQRLLKELSAAEASLNATPEGRYLSELQQLEGDATEASLHAEYLERRRGVIVVSFEEHGDRDFRPADMDEAIDEFGLVSWRADGRAAERDLVSVVADMRELTAAQLVRVLRGMADRIEHDGLEVLHARIPTEGASFEWSAIERVSGKVEHRVWPCDPREEPLR